MPTLRTMIDKARWSLHHRGVWGSVRQAVSRLGDIRQTPRPASEHPFDATHLLDTGGLITGAHLAPGHPHALEATAYCATPPSRFAALLDVWASSPPEQPISEYAFVDVGCGKGRTLLLAAALPFREIVGVDLDPGLVEIAAGNIAKCKASGLHLPPIQVLCVDAAELTLPDSPCLLYLYNPFTAAILTKLLDRIEASQRNPRSLDILYCNSLQAAAITSRPNFRMLWSGVAPITEQDAEADPCAAGEETSALFRYAG